MQQQASIKQLKDIVEPTAAHWWPPAWPLTLVILAVLSALGIIIFLGYRSWRQRHPQRIALKQLATLEHPSAKDITQICKRLALVYFPRQHIAPLNGSRWLRFLGADSEQHQELLNNAEQLLYQPASHELVDDYQQLAMQWARHARKQSKQSLTGGAHV